MTTTPERTAPTRLTPTMDGLLTTLRSMAEKHPERPDVLVSGHPYRTALALERRGLATVRYQGPALGWATLVAPPAVTASQDPATAATTASGEVAVLVHYASVPINDLQPSRPVCGTDPVGARTASGRVGVDCTACLDRMVPAPRDAWGNSL